MVEGIKEDREFSLSVINLLISTLGRTLTWLRFGFDFGLDQTLAHLERHYSWLRIEADVQR